MSILIFDGNYLLHRSMHVKGLALLKSESGLSTGGILGFLKSIHNILYKYTVNRCFVVFDGGISERRRIIYEQYKGQKYRDLSDPLYEEELDAEKIEYRSKFTKQRNILKLMLVDLGIDVIHIKAEADDICYRLANEMHKDNILVSLVSDDFDYLQCIRDNNGKRVNLIRPIKEDIVTVDNFFEKVGYNKNVNTIWRAIKGDTSDSISGVKGVGKVWLDRIFNNQYRDYLEYPYEKFFSWCSYHKTSTVRKISENKSIVLRNVGVMDLDREPYTDYMKNAILKSISSKSKCNIGKFKSALVKLDINQILADFTVWLTPFNNIIGQ